MAAHLPGAVVDIHQPLERDGLGAAEIGDDGSGHDAALQGAGIDDGRPPGARDARRQRLGLGHAFLGQGQLGAAAEALGEDAFDVAVAGQQDLGHPANLAGSALVGGHPRSPEGWHDVFGEPTELVGEFRGRQSFSPVDHEIF